MLVPSASRRRTPAQRGAWHDGGVPEPPCRQPRVGVSASRPRHALARVVWLIAIALVFLIGLVSGCTRVRTALAVQGNDTVAGEIVIARAGGPPPALAVPSALVNRVAIIPYQSEDYQGSVLRFAGLQFDEVNSLVAVAPAAEGRFRLALRRAGNRILLNGQVDLTALPVDRADVQVKVAFAGDVLSTDGRLAVHTVSWRFDPGRVGKLSAVVRAPDPAAPSVWQWAILVGALVASTALAVVLLAKAERNPPVRWAKRVR